MSPAMFFVALGVLTVIFLVFTMPVMRGGGGTVTKRAAHRQLKADRDLAVAALEEIDRKADCIRDLGDPSALLASEVREVVREYRQERLKIT